MIINDSDRNKVIGITSHQQSDGGVVLNRAHDTEVRDSDLRFNPSGVEAWDTNHLLIQDNDASDSLQTGFEVGNGVGMRILDNTVAPRRRRRHRARGRRVRRARHPGRRRADPGQHAPTRTARAASSSPTAATRIRGNIAHNNAGFGIDAGENPEIPASRSRAPTSTAAATGATGNAELEQCRGVVCLRRRRRRRSSRPT